MKRVWCAATVIAIVGSLTAVQPASAQEAEPALTLDTLYAINWGGGLYRITDPLTGTVQLIGATGITGATGFDVDSQTETGWALEYENQDSLCHLWQIDMSTGTGTDRGALGTRSNCLALDLSANGVLRGSYTASNTSVLITIDRTTGVATDGPTLHTVDDADVTVKALASDPSTGTLYARVAGFGVYTVDTTTGLLSPFSDGDPNWEAMDFSCDGSTLWVKNYKILGSTTLSPVPLVESGSVGLNLDDDGGQALAVACNVLPATGADTRAPLTIGVGFLLTGLAALGLRRRRVAA